MENNDVVLTELFKKLKKNKKEKEKWTPSEYDKVVDKGDVEKYKSLFNSIVKFAEDVSKSVIKNVTLDDEAITTKETVKGDYVEIDMFKSVISLQDNFENLKNQYGDIFEGDEYTDTDGEESCDWVTKKFLNKFKSKGFKKSEYDDVMFNYTKEGKEDDFLSVFFDEDYESLSVGMKIYYNKNNIQESTIFDNGEPLMELFGRLKKNKKDQHEKNKPLPKKVKEPEKNKYPQEQIVKEIKDVLAFSKKVLSKPGYKEFLNKGAKLSPFYNAMDMMASNMSEMKLYDEYETNDDFPIIYFDLWDYPKCGARTHEDEGYEVHPVNAAAEKMCKEIREYVNKKYPHYDVEIEGDWDTYDIMLTLK